ncbi:MAG: BTAD domain-containing putative transcriptional regulator [Gaiellaceae bacterium]|jgi:DNA-binding SARP family transcriptional activator
MIEIRILGPIELIVDGEVMPLGGHKLRALLALLVLDSNHVVSTDRLLDSLWGENPPRTAQTSLQNLVSQLRKLLASDRLETKTPGYRLRVDPSEVDAERFRALVADARAMPAAERARTLRDALSMWRGAPLADFAFESFAQSDIAGLDELRLAAVEDRIDSELELGLHAEIAGDIERLVSEHPLRERLRAQLMLALYRSGRQGAALSSYQDARRALVEELGIDPGPALQRLHASIVRQDAGLDPATAAPSSEDHFQAVMNAMLAGRLVPVLGADVAELATSLAQRFDYPSTNGAGPLTRVAQYIAVMRGSGPLYDELHALLDVDATPTQVHRFFAALPPVLRAHGAPHQLIVTTSYDVALETALVEAGEEFDVVAYLATGRDRGRFCHLAPDGTVRLIDIPNTYVDLSLERRTVILKLHGQVDRSADREWESFVVTEDDYIDYLAQADVASVVPVALAAKLRRSHFLFLGYTMADWNLRVVLNRLWGDQPLSYRSWAVQPHSFGLEREFWRRRDVDVYELPLPDYVDALTAHAGLVEVAQ